MDCPEPIEDTTWADLPDRHWVCGCGQCPAPPQPDPTPAELQARVNAATWTRTTRTE